MPTPAEQPLEFEGAFGFETLLCQLFRQIDPIAELDRQPTVDTAILQRMAAAAKRNSDVFAPRFLTADLQQATRGVLFHERVHYWQVLSTSAMQRHIVNSLNHLQLAIELDGGKKMAVWGGGSPDPKGTVQDAKFLYENLNWSGLSVFWNYETVALPNAPGTTLTRVQMGMDLETLIEGYVADLAFEDAEAGTARVPLVGRYLFESAAYVSEQLFQGEPIAPLTGPAGAEDIQYRGTWELWRRANAALYSDPTALALSFLAAVDLAVNPELPDKPTDDFQRLTIPWRFGILVQAAPNLPPLRLDQGSPADAVAAFQASYCSALGWPAPGTVALQLTAYLVRIYAPLVGLTDKLEMVQALCKIPLRQMTLDDMLPILQLINRGGEPDLIGTRVLRSAINAAIHRLFNPGRFAVPHLYADELTASFPLPAILYEGDFYIENPTVQETLSVSPLDYWSDCVRLMTIDHLRSTPPSESMTCGFVRRNLDCPYIAAGAGCPKRGLSPTEEQARRTAGLDPDWCHWKMSAIVIGLLPPDADKHDASPNLQAATASWFSATSAEDVEKLLTVHEKLWQEMSQQDRQLALAASADLQKTLTEAERAHSVDLWAIVAARAAAAAKTA